MERNRPELEERCRKAIKLLKSKETDTTKAGLEEISSVQGQAIAALAIYYLVGDISESVLLGIPLKKMCV